MHIMFAESAESTRCYQRQDEEDPGEEASTFQHKMNEDEVCLRGAGGMPQDIFWSRQQWGFKRENKGNT